MTTPTPDSGGTIDGAAPRDDVLVASQGTDVNMPGMPPGSHGDPAPVHYRVSRRKMRDSKRPDPGPAPAKNASQEEWAAYAERSGWDRDTAQAATRDELARQLGSKSSGSSSKDASGGEGSASSA